ncbi:DNA topoisomerase VI subunit B [Halospeciosus flavus]|uniref:Type 2 DNA topoisomerase 6 subunit B n=1 Tax=Halospeciosus flavus TaxID=3032283 RepID=A0ABD5Z3H6_9EURY|nr:DNA topoisomerase VI subunit B [Halospeciosus flavus]
MTSFQATLDDEEGIAEELAASQREISIAEFFEKNKHMLGFDSGARGMVTAVKEAVDNALDAAEESGILPDIYVEIREVGDYYQLIVEDNGPGITKEQVPKVFGKLLYGSRFHAREQSRGQQGIGISAAVLYSQLTSGKPAKITSRTKGDAEAQQFELTIDTDTNEPVIESERTVSWDRSHGTRIKLEMEANMRARSQLHDYIEHTAIVNPHARVELKEPKEHFKFERADGAELPEETEEIRPHPHGVELGTLMKMLTATESHSVSGFLQEEFTRVGRKTADDILDAFRDRHYGRELAWSPPVEHDQERSLEAVVTDAVSNKSVADTEAFVEEVASALRDAGDVTYTELEALVADVAESVGEDTGTTFGDTVQENVVDALWDLLTESRADDLFSHVDAATTTQKDDATVRGLAERIAEKFGEDTPRDRLTYDELKRFVVRAAETTEEVDDVTVGETARENVTEELWERAARPVDEDVPRVREVADDRDTASELLNAMSSVDVISPPTGCLSPIKSDLLEAGLKKEVDADFYAASTRDADVHGGDPFIVEAGIAYGGELQDGQVDLLRFANRVPLVYQRGACATTQVIKDIGWRNYGLDQSGGSGMPSGPCVIMVHVASTNVPFTSESKDALASVPEIEDEIELAVREAARELKSFLNERESRRKRRQKQNVIADILPKMATKVSEMTGREQLNVDDSLARIMNNVLVERRRDGDTVQVVVENHGSKAADLDVTDIVSVEPESLSAGTVVEMDGEWFVKWSPSVSGGDEAVLSYDVTDFEETDFDLSVKGVADERLTVNR